MTERGDRQPDRAGEVELFVAEIGDAPGDDQLYRLTYDGQVADEHGYAVMGGAADVVATYLKEHYAEGSTLESALRVAVTALGHSETDDRVIPLDDLEVAVLDRTRTQPRKFSRLSPARLEVLLGERGATTSAPADPEPEPAASDEPGTSDEPPVAPPT